MTILCYHAVRDDWESQLAVRMAEFEWQCHALARRRTVVDLPTAVSRLDRSGRLPKGMAAVTFDDGFEDFHSNAAPILARHNLPATMFLVAGTLADGGQPVDWVRPPATVPLSTLTVDQVRDLQSQGVRFASHSFRHLDLDTLGADACLEDLRHSKELLEDLLGSRVDYLAYPRGRHDETVRRCAERAGYSHAFSLPQVREEPGPFSVPRVGIFRGNSPMTVRLKLSRPYLPVRTGRAFPYARGLVDRVRR